MVKRQELGPVAYDLVVVVEGSWPGVSTSGKLFGRGCGGENTRGLDQWQVILGWLWKVENLELGPVAYDLEVGS